MTAFSFLWDQAFYQNQTRPSCLPHSQIRIRFCMPLILHLPRLHHLHLPRLHHLHLPLLRHRFAESQNLWYQLRVDLLRRSFRVYFQESIVLRNNQQCWCAWINDIMIPSCSVEFVLVQTKSFRQSYSTYKHLSSCSKQNFYQWHQHFWIDRWN